MTIKVLILATLRLLDMLYAITSHFAGRMACVWRDLTKTAGMGISLKFQPHTRHLPNGMRKPFFLMASNWAGYGLRPNPSQAILPDAIKLGGDMACDDNGGGGLKVETPG
ncbi:hypothetical protein DFH08DRAFT_822514 [Mycena albidolilacea]|uniref:Secreted protein n=1 Tax=Mycena albidolilacea TaxID=1033008 RepID=A0AAD7ECL5_9AGAR|nr:hypothetical protein DFH08DRAFT_822514 [Mycena albidolilacea]